MGDVRVGLVDHPLKSRVWTGIGIRPYLRGCAQVLIVYRTDVVPAQ